MNRLLCIAIFFMAIVISLNVNAINKPEQGYIVTLTGDTVKGYVDCYTWLKDNREISFSGSQGGSGIIYSPKNILAFGTEKEIYRSAVIAFDKNTLAGLYNKNVGIGGLYSDTVFLQVLVDGEKQLLFLNDSTGRENFFINIDSVYTWLTNYTYAVVKNGKAMKVDNNNYIGQLLIYLEGNRKLNEYISRTKYNTEDLIKAFDEYYRQKGIEMDYRYEKTSPNIEFGVTVGGIATKLIFSDKEADYLSKVNFAWSTNFTGGGIVNIYIPGTFHFWSLYNELTFSTFNTAANFNNTVDQNNYTVYHLELGASYINMNNMLRANISGLYYGGFLNLGISNGFAISKKNKLSKTTVTDDVSEKYSGNAVEKVNGYSPKLLFGGGISFDRLLFELRFMYGKGFTSPEKTSTNSIMLLLTYKL